MTKSIRYPQQWCCYSKEIDKCADVRKKSMVVKIAVKK